MKNLFDYRLPEPAQILSISGSFEVREMMVKVQQRGYTWGDLGLIGMGSVWVSWLARRAQLTPALWEVLSRERGYVKLSLLARRDCPGWLVERLKKDTDLAVSESARTWGCPPPEDFISYVAYPGDRPPEVCELPENCEFRGHSWGYVRLTPESARAALEVHQRDWPTHERDWSLRAVAAVQA